VSVANRSPVLGSTELQIAALFAVVAALYWPTTSSLWHRPVFGSNALLVVGLSLWLLARTRGRVAMAPVRGLPWMLLLLVPCSIASIVLWESGIPALQLLLLPVLILLAALTAFGSDVTRLIAVPVGFLYFAVPAWDLLAEPLQRLTLWVVSWAAPAIGVPATISGTMVLLPGHMQFEVTPACSGSGFLMEGLAVAVLLGELQHASVGRRLRLIASMTIIALVTNWVRVLTLIQIGYTTQMRHVLVSQYHVMFGYILFVVVLAAFVTVATARMPARPQSAAKVAGFPAAARGAFLPALLGLAAAPVAAGLLISAGFRLASI
jgi:exosortase